MKMVVSFVQESHVACHGNACILTETVFIKNASIPTVMSFTVPEVEISEIRRLFFFQPPIVLLRKYEIRGSQICASRDCAAPPPQPLPLSAPMRQS